MLSFYMWNGIWWFQAPSENELRDIPEGCIGKLKIHESGCTRCVGYYLVYNAVGVIPPNARRKKNKFLCTGTRNRQICAALMKLWIIGPLLTSIHF